jgi:FAD:protein FMN transferase
MKRRSFMQCSLGLGACLGTGAMALHARAVDAGLQWRSRTLNAMGTSMRFQVAHAKSDVAERALDAAVADIRHIEDQMSLFRPDSAISELNRNGILRNPHPDLLDILRTAQDVSRGSDGAFDITVQPLWQTFAAAQQRGNLPSEQDVRGARALVDWRQVQVSDAAIRLQRSGMGISLNGIAQGYAADKVKARFQSIGIAHALVDAGEWSALGNPAHAGDWTLGVADPRKAGAVVAAVALQGRSMATSADDQCSFSPDFANHHIFDPHTGRSPVELSSVSVLAPSCVMADALTKVFFIAGFERALPLAKAWGVDVLVVDKQGRWQASPGVLLRQV